MAVVFEFDGDDLVCERVYFDSLTMLKQLLGAVSLKRPRTWPTALRALRGLASLSGEPDQRLLKTTPPADLAT
jgi:hypothetical protein